MCKRIMRSRRQCRLCHLPIPRISRNYLARWPRHRLMRDRPMNDHPLRLGLSELFVFSVLILSGCAHPDTAQQAATYEEDFNDPLEDVNRKTFEFNQFVDRNAIVPVAKAYRDTVPDPVRDSLRDFLNNLRAPIIFANDALQGQFQQAGETMGRPLSRGGSGPDVRHLGNTRRTVPRSAGPRAVDPARSRRPSRRGVR